MLRDAVLRRDVDLFWVRGYARIEGEYVVLDSERSEEYRLQLEKPELLFRLAQVKRPIDAREFIGHYGLLFHGLEATEYREKFSEWEQAALELSSTLRLYYTFQRALIGDAEAMYDLREHWFR